MDPGSAALMIGAIEAFTTAAPLDEGPGGLYAPGDALAADEAEASNVVANAQPGVPIAPHDEGPLPNHGRSKKAPRELTLTRQAVAARVRRDHGIIHALLDGLERASALAKERRAGALDSFRRAAWDLDITFEEHLDMEEAHVAPILRGAGATGTARAVAMIVEHNEQRRVILGLVEDAESDAKDVDTLVAEAVALVRAFRIDMEIEDRSLAALLSDGPGD